MKLISGDILEEMVNSDDMTLAEFNELAMLMQRVAHREMELLERIAGLEAQVKLLKEDLQ